MYTLFICFGQVGVSKRFTLHGFCGPFIDSISGGFSFDVDVGVMTNESSQLK